HKQPRVGKPSGKVGASADSLNRRLSYYTTNDIHEDTKDRQCGFVLGYRENFNSDITPDL
ncbi:hypothetical protein MAR_007759, partial [Mya arenaria]